MLRRLGDFSLPSFFSVFFFGPFLSTARRCCLDFSFPELVIVHLRRNSIHFISSLLFRHSAPYSVLDLGLILFYFFFFSLSSFCMFCLFLLETIMIPMCDYYLVLSFLRWMHYYAIRY